MWCIFLKWREPNPSYVTSLTLMWPLGLNHLQRIRWDMHSKFISLIKVSSLGQTANLNLFFGKSRLILESQHKKQTNKQTKKAMKCDFCKSHLSHVWRLFDMRFHSDLYRCVSVQTLWPLKLDFRVSCNATTNDDIRSRVTEVHESGAESLLLLVELSGGTEEFCMNVWRARWRICLWRHQHMFLVTADLLSDVWTQIQSDHLQIRVRTVLKIWFKKQISCAVWTKPRLLSGESYMHLFYLLVCLKYYF